MKNKEILKEIIKNRRSTFPKSYSGGSIPAEILEEILESAKYAPQHKKTNPVRLQVFLDGEKEKFGKELARIYKAQTATEVFLQKKYDDIVSKAEVSSALIAIVVNYSGLLPEWEEIASVAMSVQNMYLTASANNIGCYWSTPGIVAHLKDFLNLQENQRCLGVFYLGTL